ncbi:hypothetical protein KC909_04360, partial [Candidatus Dojkabacteria bacterium]|nr:hypothetical protein [Candidatus Dojkabacteria bacterium]
MSKLRIGTGGVPLSSKSRSTLAGIERIAELGLEHMELEFVRGVKMGEDTAKDVRKTKEENNVS